MDPVDAPQITWIYHVRDEETGTFLNSNGTLNLRTIRSCAYTGFCNVPDEEPGKWKPSFVDDATVRFIT